MRDITFGQYYPTDSLIHRMDARSKLLITIIYMVAIFFVNSYVAYAIVFLTIISIISISKVPFVAVVKSIKGVMFLLFFTAILNLLFYQQGEVLWHWWKITITLGGVDFTLKMILRLTFLVMGTAILTFSTTPTELTDAIEGLLKPLNYVKVPVHDIAIIMSIALRFIPSFLEETDKIMMAQKARGATLDHGNIFKRAKAMLPILIPLFVSAFRRADELADALDARCYNATDKRTKMKILKFSFKDFAGIFLALTLFVLICLEKYLMASDGLLCGLDVYLWQIMQGVFV